MLESFITIISVYLVLTLVASGIMEAIASIFNFRSLYLRKAIKKMLSPSALDENTIPKKVDSNDSTLYHKFKSSVAVTSERRPSKSILNNLFNKDLLPSYLSSAGFFYGLLEAIGIDHSNLKKISEKMEESENEVNKHLLLFWQKHKKDSADNINSTIKAFQEEVEQWYNNSMERANGWYKRNAQLWLFAIGTFLAGGYGLDTFTIFEQAFSNSKLKKVSITFAESAVASENERWKDSVESAGEKEFYRFLIEKELIDSTEIKRMIVYLKNKKEPRDSLSNVKNQINDLEKILTTEDDPLVKKAGDVLSVLKEIKALNTLSWCENWLGYLLTGFLISMGAPFWFDLLRQIMQVRFAGTTPKKEKKE